MEGGGSTVAVPKQAREYAGDVYKRQALYDGDYSEDEQLIEALIAAAKELQAAVEALGPIAP